MVIKKIVYFGFIIFALFVINDLAGSIYTLWQKNDLVDQGKQTLERERRRNLELKRQYKIVREPQFVEEEARNKLFMVKPGEEIIVAVPTVAERPKIAEIEAQNQKQNWQKWMDLFF